MFNFTKFDEHGNGDGGTGLITMSMVMTTRIMMMITRMKDCDRWCFYDCCSVLPSLCLIWFSWWWYIDGDDDYKDGAFTIAAQFCQVCQLWFDPPSSCRGTNYKVWLFLLNFSRTRIIRIFLIPLEWRSSERSFTFFFRSGMSAVPEWLKSLRLHKYTGLVKLFLTMSNLICSWKWKFNSCLL